MIADENNIDIEKKETMCDVRQVVSYFRTLWKERPAISNSDKGSKPILDEYDENER